MRPLFFLVLSLLGSLTPLFAQTAKQEYIPIQPLLLKAQTAEFSWDYATAADIYGEIIAILARQPDPDLDWLTYQRAYCLVANKRLIEGEQLRRNYLYYTQKLNPAQPIATAYAYAGMAAVMRLRKDADSLTYWGDKARAIADTINPLGANANHKARLYYEIAANLDPINNQTEAISYLNLARETLLNSKNVDAVLQLKVLINLCNLHRFTGSWDKVLRYNQEAQRIAANIPTQSIKWLKYRLLNNNMDLEAVRNDPDKTRKQMQVFEQFALTEFGDTSLLYIKCLIMNGLMYKDALGDIKTMETYFFKVEKILQSRQSAYEEIELSDMYRNWAYTYLERWSTDRRYDTTYAYFHKAFLLTLSPKYRDLKYNEYPDFQNPDIYQHTYQLTYRALMGIQYNLFTHYTDKRQKREKDNLLKIIPVINELKNTLLRNTYNSQQRLQLAYVFEDYYYKKMEMYGDFYGQDSALATQKELFITLQQLNSRESRFGVNQQQSLALAGVDKLLIAQQEQITKTIKELSYQLNAAQKLNDKDKVLNLSAQISNQRSQLAQLDQKIKQQYPRYNQLITQLPTVSIEKIQSLLGDKAMLIYGAARYRTLQMLITKDTVLHYYTFIDRDNLWRPKLDSLRTFFQTPPAQSAQQQGYKQRYYNLLAQVSQQFFKQDSFLQARKIADLIIVPDALLANMPFELMLTAYDDADKGYKDWDFALKKYSIQYLPDVSFWLQSQSQSDKNGNSGKLLAFAPTYQRGVNNPNRPKHLLQLRANLSELSGAKNELANLAAYYYGNFYQDTTATEAQFKRAIKNSYAVVHLAMHGLLDEDAADLSALAFAETQDSTEDNFLTAYEIAQMDNKAQLIVLSACETAAGENQTGEGVLSLARYFMYGGAPAVVATRWQINDQTTAFIMQNFYKYLYEGVTIKQALRKAQLDYLAQAKGDGTAPFYWAAFTNIGHTDKTVYIANKNWYLKYIVITIALFALLILFYWYKRKAAK